MNCKLCGGEIQIVPRVGEGDAYSAVYHPCAEGVTIEISGTHKQVEMVVRAICEPVAES